MADGLCQSHVSRNRRCLTCCPLSVCRSAFFVFCSEYRPSVKQQYPGLSIGDCAKKLGEMWSKLSQSEKQPYEEKAQKLREKYDRVRHRQHGRHHCELMLLTSSPVSCFLSV